MDPPPHRQTLEQLKGSVAGLGWGCVRPVKRRPATDTGVFRSHYTAFRGEPLVLEGATAAWPLVAQGVQHPGEGAIGALTRWLEDTPVQTLTLRYSDGTAGEGDLTFDAAQRELRGRVPHRCEQTRAVMAWHWLQS